MKLGVRLKAVADMVPDADVIADIGTDHGYIPIYLVQKGRVQRAIATDIHEGPAKRAEIHIQAACLKQKIEVRTGGGFSVLTPGEVSGVIIAGMGGFMIRDILRDGQEQAERMKWFVLQPNNHTADLRIWLSGHGYQSEKEVLCEENGKLYEIFLINHGTMAAPSGLMADMGRLAEFSDKALLLKHIERLIAYRKHIVEGISEDTASQSNQEKRRQAQIEISRLEEWKWKLTHR